MNKRKKKKNDMEDDEEDTSNITQKRPELTTIRRKFNESGWQYSVSPLGTGVEVDMVAQEKTVTGASEVFGRFVDKMFCAVNISAAPTPDYLRSNWIADDTRGIAPAGYLIDSHALYIPTTPYYATVSVSRPTKGWPLGDYHLELIFGDLHSESVHFTIIDEDEPKKN